MYRRLFAIGALLIPSLAFAASISLVPTLDLSQADENRRLGAVKSQTMQLEGSGDRMVFVYSSDAPIDIDVAPMVFGATFNPADLAHTTLPAGKDMEVIVDLTQAPSWRPWGNRYYIGFFVTNIKTDAELQGIQIMPAGIGTNIAVALKQLMHAEEFQVSTPHGMRGYLMWNTSLAIIIGLITLLCVVIFRKRGAHAFVVIVLIGMLVYGLRWNSDLVGFSFRHLSQWNTHFTYAQAGSAYEIADALKKESTQARQPVGVFVCTSSTDFVTKVLRYSLYPIPVSIVPEDVQKSSHIVVTHIGDWSYNNGMLHCGRIDGKATKVREFSDGSVLFTTYH